MCAVASRAPDANAEAAREAGLRYVSDAVPGITRRRAGKHFSYRGPDGELVRDERVLARVRSLAIPPAWTDVWICPDARGHIQATGRDARGRKQYRYHPLWRSVRDENKYGRLIEFGQALPEMRRRAEEDLGRPGLPREKVLAAATRLLDETLIRVGNAEYARQNKSFGLTTLRDRHVRVDGETLRFRFRGKSGKEHDIEFRDRRLARVVKRCQDLPGYDLFQYVDDDGERRRIESADVNDYLREISGQEFTAKDFRTWGGTVLAAQELAEGERAESDAAARRIVVGAIEQVARHLGNTPAVCRSCYIHPGVVESYLDGTLQAGWGRRLAAAERHLQDGLEPEEQAVLSLLRQLRKDAAEQAPAA